MSVFNKSNDVSIIDIVVSLWSTRPRTIFLTNIKKSILSRRMCLTFGLCFTR